MRHAALVLLCTLLSIFPAADRIPRTPGLHTESAAWTPPLDGIPGYSGTTIGGPDRLVYFEGDGAQRIRLSIAPDGLAFLSWQQNGDLYIARSIDGGDVWQPWALFSLPDSSIGASDLVVLDGDVRRIYVAYAPTSPQGEARVAYADPHDAVPVWGEVLFPSWYTRELDFTDDAADFSTYVVYLVGCTSTEIRFSLTTGFGSTWIEPYEIDPAGGPFVFDLKLAYGFGGVLHAAWREVDGGEQRIAYKKGSNFGFQGPGGWHDYGVITPDMDGLYEGQPRLAPSLDTPDVLLGYVNFDPLDLSVHENVVMASPDSGDTWAPTDTVHVGYGYNTNLVYRRSAGDWILGLMDLGQVSGGPADFRPYLSTSKLADPLLFDPLDQLGQHGYATGSAGEALDLALDPSRGWAPAAGWLDTETDPTPDSVWFDATPLGDPYVPLVEPGFPVHLTLPPFSFPGLANLDDDPDLEIVFEDLGGFLQAFNPDGSEVAGWPISVGSPVQNPRAAVAVGDLDGDGRNEVAVGDALGTLHVFERDGTPKPGWPIDFGDGDVWVSIGPVSSPTSRELVMVRGSELHVLTVGGSELPGFPVLLPGSPQGPPAIGDVDDDGTQEIVVTCGGTTVEILGHDGSIEAQRGLQSTIADAATLGDLDLDGDLEVIVPTSGAWVYAMDHQLTDLPGFPVAGTSDPSAVIMANVLGNSGPEIILNRASGQTMLYFANGSAGSGYPTPATSFHPPVGPPLVDNVDSFGGSVVSGWADSTLVAFDNFGSGIPGYPKPLTDAVVVPPASGDFDRDGRIELAVLTSTDVYLFDTGGTPANIPYDNGRWTMPYFDSGRTNCFQCLPSEVTGIPDGGAPDPVMLAVPRPNPSRGAAVLRFVLPGTAPVALAVYDVTGARVRSVLREYRDTGEQEVTWDGTDDRGRPVTAGVYYVRLSVGGREPRTETRPLVVTR